jgi:hypothetical protein
MERMSEVAATGWTQNLLSKESIVLSTPRAPILLHKVRGFPPGSQAPRQDRSWTELSSVSYTR